MTDQATAEHKKNFLVTVPLAMKNCSLCPITNGDQLPACSK